jgi:hypothetical protein
MKLAAGLLTLTTTICIPSAAASDHSARSLGMASSFQGNTGNCEAALLNPANLGWQQDNRWSVQILAASVQAGNNAFGLADYNKYNGAYLSAADKEEILAKIPASGLDLHLAAQGGALSFSYRGFAISTEVIGGGRGWLPRGPIELALMGNTIGETVSAAGTDGDGWAAFALGFSHGRKIVDNSQITVTAGLTLRYLRGLSYYGVDELAAEAITEMTGISADGGLTTLEATSGSGYAVDLGWSAIYKQTNLSLLAENVIANLTWNQGTTERFYQFSLVNLTAENADDDTIWNSEEFVIPRGEFNTKPPVRLVLSGSRMMGDFLTAVGFEQGFENTPFTSTSPRLAVGTEYKALDWLALRGGLAVGGSDEVSLSLGTGFGFGPWRLDFGYAAASRLLPWGGTGGTAAISSYLNF